MLAYFPDALRYIALVSAAGNEQHNPGQPLHWDRGKSGDEYDACARHLLDRASGVQYDTDGKLHIGKVAWRACAALQKELEEIDRELEIAAAEAEYHSALSAIADETRLAYDDELEAA